MGNEVVRRQCSKQAIDGGGGKCIEGAVPGPSREYDLLTATR